MEFKEKGSSDSFGLSILFLHLVSEKDKLLSFHSGCTEGRKEEQWEYLTCALEVPSLGTPYF